MDSLEVYIIIYDTDLLLLLQDKGAMKAWTQNRHSAKQSHPVLEKYAVKTTKGQMERKRSVWEEKTLILEGKKAFYVYIIIEN